MNLSNLEEWVIKSKDGMIKECKIITDKKEGNPSSREITVWVAAIILILYLQCKQRKGMLVLLYRKETVNENWYTQLKTCTIRLQGCVGVILETFKANGRNFNLIISSYA